MTNKNDSKEVKESTSLKIRPSIWKKAKLEAVKKDIQLSDLVEKALEQWIKDNE